MKVSLLLTTVFLFVFMDANGQLVLDIEKFSSPNTAAKDSVFYATYNNVKQLYIKALQSPSHLKKKEVSDNYLKKWRRAYNGTGEELGRDPGGLTWIKRNIAKTQFSSFEEAKAEYNITLKATDDYLRENSEFTEAYFDALNKYGSYIYHDLELEMKMEYPEYFIIP